MEQQERIGYEGVEQKDFRNPNSKTTIAQHNDLVFSKYSMTELQHNIFLKLLTQINKDDEKFYLFKIPYRQLVGKGGKNFDLIQEAVRRLDSTRVEIWMDGEWVRFPLFGLSKANPKKRYIEIKFNEDMRPYLLDLKGKYTLTYFHYISSISDVQSRRIYEFLKANEDKYEVEFKVSSLKSWLGIENSYERFRDFRRFILEKAQKQLEKTDMAFTFRPVKQGRAVLKIKFIRKKRDLEIPFPILPATNVTNQKHNKTVDNPLSSLYGKEFLEACREFSSEEIDKILSLGKGDYNRRIFAIKSEYDYRKIRAYFDDVI